MTRLLFPVLLGILFAEIGGDLAAALERVGASGALLVVEVGRA